MKKSQKKNYVVVALIVVLLFLAIGYAAFSEVLTVSGTATGAGKWNVHFGETATLSPSTYGTPEVSTDGKTITVDDLTLGYPGDGCTLTFSIVNEGTLPADLTSLKILNKDGSEYANDDITITAPEIAGEELAAGENCEVTVAIAWDADSEATDAKADFKIEFTYAQASEAVTVSPSHTH